MLLAVVASIAASTPLRAQGVPLWAVGVDAGSGPQTGRAGEVYYRENRATSVRLSARFRVVRAGPIAPVVHLEATAGGMGQHLDCLIAPNGTCAEYGPENGGWGIGAGLAYAPVRFVESSLIAGRGRYANTGRNFVEAQVALSPLRHVAVTASLAHITWKARGGYPHWYRPMRVGLRVQ